MTTPDDSPITCEIVDGVATVTLARPDAMNSLTLSAKVALRDALHAVAADGAVRCVVLTGSGRAFCVGQDLREHVERDRSDGMNTVVEHYNPIVTAIATMPKPVIAAVNGIAAGAGSWARPAPPIC
jgi:2-(1,2-epoxy-1,2-dihydrophenyl)acetyl-CoA isomerase